MHPEFVKESDPVRAERNLAAEQLRQMVSERNRLQREIAAREETISHFESGEYVVELQRRVEVLQSALEDRRRAIEEMENSRSWKLTRPLRACIKLFRGGS